MSADRQMDGSNPAIDKWQRHVPHGLRRPTVIGLSILALWIGGFGLWAALAPLDGAVVASGSFVATGQNKPIFCPDACVLAAMNRHIIPPIENTEPIISLVISSGSFQCFPYHR